MTKKNKIVQILIVTFLTITVWGTSCNRPVKKDLPNEKEHPKLIKQAGNGNLSCIIQDKVGNLWVGTSDNGLYQYDGKSFKQFGEKDGLSSNDVYCLLEDTAGKIWIGTKAGLSLYDGKSFTIFRIDEAANGFLTANDKVERIFEDKEGNIWLGGRTNKGVYRYDGKTVTNLQPMDLFQNGPTPKAHNWGWPQLQDRKGNIWFSNWGGAYRYDGNTFTGFRTKDGLPREVTRIIEDKKGNIWFGAADGLRLYDGKTFIHFKDGLINPWIWTILEDKNGNIWVGTRGEGLYLFDGKTFINYTQNKQ